ncbi:7-cyano-7-deazaguanine synthase [Candidatus Pelagibacter sp.]|nr:7-cyano-7-deazaguanine synthase [Candidatus Pelagibacter sp.]
MAYLRFNNIILQKKGLKTKKFTINNIEYFFIGDFYNILFDNKLYKLTELKHLLNKYSIETILCNSIGKFFVIKKNKNNIEIFNSFSFAGLYFIKEKEKFYFATNEKEILKKIKNIKISKNFIHFYLNAHRQISYLPLNGIDQRVSRLPSGMSLLINNKNQYKYNLYSRNNTYFYNKNFLVYNKIFSNIFNSYKKNIKKKITILFSGGMDSTVLIAKAIENKINFDSVYFNRAMKLNICEMMVKYLSKKFKFKSKIVEMQNEKLNENNFNKNKKLKSHYNIIGSIKELVYQNNYDKNKIFMSGQNADTLYYVDTFAPNTYIISFNRLLGILKSIHLRFFYTNFFLKIITNNFFLKLLMIDKNQFFKKKIENLIFSYDEHVSWINLPKKNNKDYFLTNRKKYFLNPFLKLLKIKNFDNLNQKDLYRILISVKWLRFVVNTHLYFNELGVFHKSKFITPFSEGPMVNYFSNNHVDLKEIFSIKPFQKKIIKNILGFNFLFKQISLRLSVLFTKKYRTILKNNSNNIKVDKNLKLINLFLLRKLKKHKLKYDKFLNIKKFNINQKIRFLNFLIFFSKIK